MRPRPPLWLGMVVAALGVALTTLIVYPLEHAAPVLSLGVVYMLIVLVVASLWGLWLGAATAVASALAFNFFFHIPPTRALREWSQAPILVLSAVGEEDEKVRALEAGADDFMTKPFGPRELVARLQAALRRAGAAAEDPVLRADGLELHLAAHTLRRDGAEVHLTPIELSLLKTLMQHRGRLLTARPLLVTVWGPAYAEDTRTLRTHLSNLRRKLDPDGTRRYVHTDPGVGYRFAA